MISTRGFEPEDWAALMPVLKQSFNAPASGWERFRGRIGDANFRVATRNDAIIGGCAIYPMGQWWMGRSVPLGGVAGVGVAPEHRGRGVARAMMTDVLHLLHHRGVPVAGLYPATQHLYRSVGYDQAGSRVLYEAPLASLTGFRFEVETRQVDPTSASARAAFVERYRPVHGNLDRSAAMWDRLTRPYDGERYAWLIGDDGYLILEHTSGQHWDLAVFDLCAPSLATARTLLALLAGNRSMCEKVRWYGTPNDPLLLLFPEPTWQVKELWRWMLRIVDLRAALEARGWANDGELHLRVQDDLLPHNTGDWLLTIAEGRARCVPGGRGDLRCSVRGLAPLYSGFLTGTTLSQLGLLEGPAAALSAADRLFAAPTPWMRELY